MQKMMRMLAVVAASSLAFVGCSGGDGDGDTDGGDVAGCTAADADGGVDSCTGTQHCDPVTNTCVDNCNATSTTNDSGVVGCGSGEVCNNSTGTCQAACTSTSCGMGNVCNPDTGFCVTACTATSCTGGQVCGPDGFCEDECQDEGCLMMTTAQLCVESTNACGTPDEATGTCSVATATSGLPAGHNMIPSRDPAGPIVYDIVGMTGGMMSPNCTSGTDIPFTLSFKYQDPNGDAYAPTSTTQDGPLYYRIDTWFKKMGDMSIVYKEGFDKLLEAPSSNTGSMGSLTIGYCFASADQPSEIVISLYDRPAGGTMRAAGDHPSNKVCVEY